MANGILRITKGCGHPAKLRYPVTWRRGKRRYALCMACSRLHELGRKSRS